MIIEAKADPVHVERSTEPEKVWDDYSAPAAQRVISLGPVVTCGAQAMKDKCCVSAGPKGPPVKRAKRFGSKL